MPEPKPPERRIHRVLYTTPLGSVAIKLLAAKAGKPIGQFLEAFAKRMPSKKPPRRKTLDIVRETGIRSEVLAHTPHSDPEGTIDANARPNSDSDDSEAHS